MRTFAHVTVYGWGWLAWLVFGVGYELYWLVVNTRNTLSDQTWAIEHVNLSRPFMLSDWTALHWIIAISLWLFFGWLSLHLPFGILR